MTKPPASTTWQGESNRNSDEEVGFQARHNDAETGVRVIRMTCLPWVSTHIYPEAPVHTPDGRRFVIRRTNPFTGEGHYWVGDMERRQVRQITDEPGALAPMVTPDGSAYVYSVGRQMWRMDPDTFERELWWDVPLDVGAIGGATTISHCGTRVLCSWRQPPDRFGLAALDLAHQSARVAFEHPDCRNPHGQYCRGPHYKIMVQVNDGIEHDAHGNVIRLIGDHGASLHVANDDGSDPVKLNVGSQPRQRVQGHQCWLGGEVRAITSTHRRDAVGRPWRQDQIIAIAPGDPEGQVVAQGEMFCHMHTTKDGRFWISDCNQTARIFIGSVRTGRYKLIVNSGSSFGSHQATHPHPFFLGDDRSIGWNSDVSGIPQVYVAPIPDGFLDDLD